MTTPVPEEKKKTVRLTGTQWAEAAALWEAGDMTVKAMSAKYGITPKAITDYFARHEIKRGASKEARKKAVAAEMTAAAVGDAAMLSARIRETKEEHYKMSTGLAKLSWAEVLQAKKDGAPLSTAINNLKAIDIAMSILKKAREERYAVLGLDRPDAIDPDEVPDLVISELTAEDVAKLRDRSFSEFDDIEVGDIDDDDANDTVEEG